MSKLYVAFITVAALLGISSIATAAQIYIPEPPNITINTGGSRERERVVERVVVVNGDATVRVGGASLRFNGEIIKGHEYTGPCPVELKFGWGVISTAPTTMTYTFKRSDNAHGRAQSKTIPAANKSVPVYETWRLGANNKRFDDFKGWVELNVESPNSLEYKIPFTLHCQ